MKLSDAQKQDLIQIRQKISDHPLLILQARTGRTKHTLTARLLRDFGPLLVIGESGSRTKIARQYGQKPGNDLGAPGSPVWVTTPHELQSAVLRGETITHRETVIIDVRPQWLGLAQSLCAAVSARRTVIWHHPDGTPLPDAIEQQILDVS